MSDNIIKAIQKYILTCPLLDNEYRVNVDYLSESMSYSIDPLPSQSTIAKYADGEKKKQYQFSLSSKELYDENARVNIENSGFYQAFEEWIEEQDDKEIYPILSNDDQEPYGLEVLTSGYIYDTEGENAMYRIDCRLLYTQRS